MAVHTSGFTERDTYILGSDMVPHFDAVFMTGLSKCTNLMYLHPILNGLAVLPISDLTDLQNPPEHQFTSARIQFPTYIRVPFLELHVPGNLCKSELTAPKTYISHLIGYVYVFIM